MCSLQIKQISLQPSSIPGTLQTGFQQAGLTLSKIWEKNTLLKVTNASPGAGFLLGQSSGDISFVKSSNLPRWPHSIFVLSTAQGPPWTPQALSGMHN